ncbi:MAG TPA: hypothetical protein VMG59_06870 [Phycisphaerae bacterium]|nr:hypothetical protein [Phycisphaerae bacterium]
MTTVIAGDLLRRFHQSGIELQIAGRMASQDLPDLVFGSELKQATCDGLNSRADLFTPDDRQEF